MKRCINLLPLVLVMIFTLNVNGQNLVKGKPGMWPTFIKYQTNAPAFVKGNISLPDHSGKSVPIYGLMETKSESDKRNMTHYRYEQRYNGIKVEHAGWIIHTKNGKIVSQNGKLVKDFPPSLQKKASIDTEKALNLALKYVGAAKYKWEIKEEEDFLKREQHNASATFFPKAELVYYSGENDIIPSSLRLAYKFDIYAHEPLGRQYLFIDAQNGKILGNRNLLHESNASGTAVTAYSGTQMITADFTGSLYRLRETARGGGNGIVNTFNLQNTTNYNGAVDFTDTDNIWNNVNANKDEYATDAHWGTEKTYDYFLQKHNRNSIDDAGFPLNSYVHYSSSYFNAFWDGYRMTYGDGNSLNNNKPLTSLDVCGHEISHGLTEHTSGLIYSDESGALNEAFSDIFGTAIEWFARPSNKDWLIGGDFYTIRSMSNPNSYNDPDTYEGDYWVSDGSDYGGVHSNSGVLNYWFYLLTVGGNGTNDHNYTYAVSGIGMDKAASIAYRLNSYYLLSTSEYMDARTFGIQAAEDLFGVGSQEATQTANAFAAVGLYAPSCDLVQNPAAVSVLDHQSTLSWSPVNGATGYRLQFKENSSSSWINVGAILDTTIVLSMLNSSTLYDWRVRPDCNGYYSYGQFMTQSPICNAPLNAAAVIRNDTAVVEWQYANHAVSYQIDYKPAADSVWVSAGTTTANTKMLTGLFPSTLYECRISSLCGFDSSSFSSVQFTTNTPVCGIPANLQATFSPNNVTTFSWLPVSGADSYSLQLNWLGAGLDNAPIDTVLQSNSLVINGLISGVSFDWRVRSVCPENISFHAYSTLITPCTAPSGLNVSNITNTGAALDWNAANVVAGYGYNIYYKLSTSSTWIYKGNTIGTSYVFNNLMPGKTYDCQIKTSCQEINSTGIIAQFTTLCNAVPSNLTFTELKTTSVKLLWAAIPGVNSYTLQYKKASASTWATVSGVTNSNYTLNNLTPNTAYQYKVMAVCSAGSTSYSSIAAFTTYCVSTGSNAAEWIDWFQIGSISRISSIDAGGYIHTGLSANLTIGSAGNTGQISAGFSGAARTQMYAVYIDLNRNGSFADAGERVVGPVNISTGGNFNFSFNIPSTASPGVTGLRVVMLRVANGVSMAPCLTGKRGETEDYFVNLVNSSALNSGIPAYESDEVTARMLEPEAAALAEGKTSAVFKVMPNPSDGLYSIEIPSDFKISSYEITDVNGVLIEQMNSAETSLIPIQIYNQPSGMYLLRLLDRNGRQEILKLLKY